MKLYNSYWVNSVDCKNFALILLLISKVNLVAGSLSSSYVLSNERKGYVTKFCSSVDIYRYWPSKLLM